jgi:hypothetical protein
MNQRRLVPAFPQRPSTSISGIDVSNEASTNGLHNFGDAVVPRRRYEEVNMIRHEDVGMNITAMRLATFTQAAKVNTIIVLAEKDWISVVPPLNYVQRLPRQYNTWVTRHRAKSSWLENYFSADFLPKADMYIYT